MTAKRPLSLWEEMEAKFDRIFLWIVGYLLLCSFLAVFTSCGDMEETHIYRECPEFPLTEQEYLDNLARKDEKIRELEGEVLSWQAAYGGASTNLIACRHNLSFCEKALAQCAEKPCKKKNAESDD